MFYNSPDKGRRGYFILLREYGSNIKSQLLVTPLTDLDVFLYENNSAYLSLLSLQTSQQHNGQTQYALHLLPVPNSIAAATNPLGRTASLPQGALMELTLKSNFGQK